MAGVDTEPKSTPAPSPQSSADSLAPRPSDASTKLASSSCSMLGIQHMVLRLAPAAIHHLQGAQFQFVAQSDIPALAASSRQLIDVLAALRSPNSGWPTEQPQTPDNLLPYLLDEAQDVQEAWQRDTFLRPSNERRQPVACHLTLAALASPLIWSIAAQSPVFMQLLEGIEARIFRPGQDWQLGQIRLAVWLVIHTEQQQESFDLVTQRPPGTLLDSQTLVQVKEREFWVTPTWTQQLQLELDTQFTYHPLLDEVISGLDVDILRPEQGWQAGNIQLQYGLEFLPLAQQVSGWQTGIDDAQRLVQVHMQNEAWTELMGQATAQQRFLQEMVWQGWEMDQPVQMPDPRWLIQCACWAGTENSSNLGWAALPNPIRLRSLGYRILWSIIQASYRATCLMAGIKAQVFSPQQPWQTGHVRLRPRLAIQTAKGRWATDLSTGTRLNPYVVKLESSALIQFQVQEPSMGLPAHLVSVADLQEPILRQLQRRSPELEGWLHGVEIELQPISAEEQEKTAVQGRLQLDLALELVPESLETHAMESDLIEAHMKPYSVVQSLP